MNRLIIQQIKHLRYLSEEDEFVFHEKTASDHGVHCNAQASPQVLHPVLQLVSRRRTLNTAIRY